MHFPTRVHSSMIVIKCITFGTRTYILCSRTTILYSGAGQHALSCGGGGEDGRVVCRAAAATTGITTICVSGARRSPHRHALHTSAHVHAAYKQFLGTPKQDAQLKPDLCAWGGEICDQCNTYPYVRRVQGKNPRMVLTWPA